MITDHSVLQPDVQPARELIRHRNAEIDHLTSVLEPLSEGISTTGAFLWGPSGSGKTTTARCVLEDLERVAEVDVSLIDCLSVHSRRAVLNSVLEALGEGPSSLRQGTTTEHLAGAIERAIGRPTVIVLDEADQVDSVDVLQELYEIQDLTLILIANQPWRSFDRGDPRVDSRIGSLPSIPFERYTERELVSILEKRAEIGVAPGALADSVLETVAQHAGNDARRAISLLYQSLLLARRSGADRVDEQIVIGARDDAERESIRSRLSSLSRDQRRGLEAALEVGPAQSGAIYHGYDERSSDAVSQRTFRSWLSKFVEYKLVVKEGDEHCPIYRVRSAVESELSVSASLSS